MTKLDDLAKDAVDAIDRRWGLDSTDGITDFMRATLRDAAIELGKETKLPQGEDEAELLARFIARQHGIDELTNDLDAALDFRAKAVHVIDAVESSGIKLADLLVFFYPEPS